jgi:hypothetical protein
MFWGGWRPWLAATDQGRKRARSGGSGGRCLHPYNLGVEHRHSATIIRPKGNLRRATCGHPQVQTRALLTDAHKHKLITL